MAQELAPPDEAEPALDVITDPAVRAALEMDREEPADYVRAILMLVDLGETKRAVPIVEELAQLQLTDEQRAELVAKVGTAAMHRLASNADLGLAAKEFANATMEAAANVSTSPERLGQLVEQLGAESAGARRNAAVELATTGIDGVKFLIAALADSPSEAQRAGIRQALVGLAPRSVPPLFAVVESRDERLLADVIAVLAQVGGRNAATVFAVPALLERPSSVAGETARQSFQRIVGEHVTPELAERLLRHAIENHLKGTPPFRPDEEGLVEMWKWNPEQKQLESARLTIQDAGLVRASRLANDLAQLSPENRAIERQALLLELESNWILGQESAVDLTNIDPFQLSEVLRSSLESRRYGTAMAVAAELGKRGDTSVLYTADGKPSPLAAALNSSHPQVRFAALSALMQLDPKTPYAGSSRVADVLMHFAAGAGKRKAVVAMPPIGRAVTLAGQLGAEQIEAAPVELGSDAITRAAQSSDVEMILVDMTIERPDVREVLFQLRRTPATGLVPIGLLAPAGWLADAEQIAREHQGVIAFSRPHTPEAISGIVDKLDSVLPRSWPDAEDRREQGAQALEWIDNLLSEDRRFYNVRGRPSEMEATLTAMAIPTDAQLATLAKLGTAASQRSLVTYVNQSGLPIEVRQQAAAAFAKAVDQHGLMLTTKEIHQQYDHYNASETADEATQQVLGTVLDTIEKQSKQQAEGR